MLFFMKKCFHFTQSVQLIIWLIISLTWCYQFFLYLSIKMLTMSQLNMFLILSHLLKHIFWHKNSHLLTHNPLRQYMINLILFNIHPLLKENHNVSLSLQNISKIFIATRFPKIHILLIIHPITLANLCLMISCLLPIDIDYWMSHPSLNLSISTKLLNILNGVTLWNSS